MKILFIGDVFGEQAIVALEKHLKKIISTKKIDFVIVQGENISGRKGLVPNDYMRLKKAGVNAFTMGNHVWAKDEIHEIINNEDIIRPYNVANNYPGRGSQTFLVRGNLIRVTSIMGIEFNELRTPWKQNKANSFFDALDNLQKEINDSSEKSFHIIDFHAEVTSEKAVFGLYADGKVGAVLGTHTHVQTNDARKLPKGTVFITDVGMTGPINSAIGANFQQVYTKMRFGARDKFETSSNPIQLNAVIINVEKNDSTIEILKKDLR